jgi:hypothetical protein
MDVSCGTWNVGLLHRAGSVMAVRKEGSKYNLDLVGVQNIRYGRGGMKTAY